MLEIIVLVHSEYIFFTAISLSFSTSRPTNLERILPLSVGLDSTNDSRFPAVVNTVNKKSLIVPIDSLINVSVSLLCSPVKFFKLPSFSLCKNSKEVLTDQSPFFVFLRSIFLIIIYSFPSISTSPWTVTSLSFVNLLNISIAFDDFVVLLKNKNSIRSTANTDLPPKLGGLESITVIPPKDSMSNLLFLPKDRKLEKLIFLI